MMIARDEGVGGSVSDGDVVGNWELDERVEGGVGEMVGADVLEG